MYHKPLDHRWSIGDTFETSTMSTDFQPMPRSQKRSSVEGSIRSSLSVDNSGAETPVIKVKASSVIAVLLEKDESVSKLGGEISKTLAFEKMQSMAAKFFQIEPPAVTGIWDVVRQAKYHDQINQVCSASR